VRRRVPWWIQFSEHAPIFGGDEDRAAVPYEPGMSIFVPAQIANVSELQGATLFRYGVAYVRSPKR
jgi:hypothetical protein